MKTKNTLKKALVAICVLALLVSVMPASVFAEEEIEIPEEDYLYVNGESKVLTAGEEMTLLCLVVEDPGKVHVLASGVDITLVLFDDTAGEVRGVYTSEHGLMDVPFFAAPGMFILGITGNGEVEILAADEEGTEAIYSAEEGQAKQPAEAVVDQPAETPAEEVKEEAAASEASQAPATPEEAQPTQPAEEVVEESADEAAEVTEELPDEQAFFEAKYASAIALYREFGQWADLSSVPYEDQLRIKELVDGPAAEPAEEVVEELVEAPVPVTEVTIAVERGEGDAVRLFAEEDLGEEYLYQWQYSLDGEDWFDIAGANNSDYTFTLDNTNGRYYWRLIVSVK